MQLLPPACLLALAAFLALVASGCSEAPELIELGPRPARPVDVWAEDAGEDLPDGSIPCGVDSECEDGVACTVDQCLPRGYCRSVTDYTRCSDNVYCNGIEVCDAFMGCLPGTLMTCDDFDPCTMDSCSDELKSCVHAPRDFDDDGEADVHCPGGTDCDDFDRTRGTQRAEICTDLVDNDCDNSVDERECGSPEHDTCADALELFHKKPVEVVILGAVNDYSSSCSPASDTQDVVFTFVLDKPSDVKMMARGKFNDGTDEIATLSLQTRCGILSSELQCAKGFPADLRARALPAGRYFVTASSKQVRSMVVSLDIAAATPAPANATCENAIDVGKGGRFEGDFVDVGDETLSVCGVPNQPDVFYTFTLDKESDVEISAVSQEPGDLTISVRDSCDPMSQVRGCRAAEPALTRLHQLLAGRYVIALEGPSSSEVSYALEVAILDPTPAPVGDGCTRPMPIVAGTPELVPLSDKQAEVKSSCESNGPDAVFLLHLDVARDVELHVDAEDTLAVAALQRTCGDVASERGCKKGGPVQTRLRNVEPGDYYVIVDSPAAQAVTVQVITDDPTPTTPATGNDTCATATDIPLSGGIFSGDTRDMLSDYGATCGGGAASNDAVFRLVLPYDANVRAELSSGFDAVLHRINEPRPVPDACQNIMSENCSDDTGTNTGAVLDESLRPGTYYYVVDGFRDFNAGYYQLDVAISPQ